MPFIKPPLTGYLLYTLSFFLTAILSLAAQEKGGEFKSLQIATDTSLRYSLYLPSGYSPANKYPLIIFLDPAARGELPLKLYTNVADSLKIIFAGSNTSRNFNPGSSEVAIAAIYNELISKNLIDTSAVFLAGFSGGARMACSFAAGYLQIKGVIGCGAGLPDRESFGKRRKIPYAGIVGFSDMNFEEMISISQWLDDLANKNIFFFFNDGHRWPPVKYMQLAACWLLSGKQSRECSAGNFFDIFQSVVDKKDSGFMYPAWLIARQLRKTSMLQQPADSIMLLIEKHPGFEKDLKEFTAAIDEERKYMDEFTVLFNQVVFSTLSLENEDAWKQKAAWIKRMKKSKRKYFPASATRALDFSWRLCVEYYYQLIADKLTGQANKVAIISSYFQPEGRSLPQQTRNRIQ